MAFLNLQELWIATHLSPIIAVKSFVCRQFRLCHSYNFQESFDELTNEKGRFVL